METFYYKHRGTSNEFWGVGIVVAPDKPSAAAILTETYGASGIKLEFCSEDDFQSIAATLHKDLIHRIGED